MQEVEEVVEHVDKGCGSGAAASKELNPNPPVTRSFPGYDEAQLHYGCNPKEH